MVAHGWSAGLPLMPSTQKRGFRLLAGTRRDAQGGGPGLVLPSPRRHAGAASREIFRLCLRQRDARAGSRRADRSPGGPAARRHRLRLRRGGGTRLRRVFPLDVDRRLPVVRRADRGFRVLCRGRDRQHRALHDRAIRGEARVARLGARPRPSRRRQDRAGADRRHPAISSGRRRPVLRCSQPCCSGLSICSPWPLRSSSWRSRPTERRWRSARRRSRSPPRCRGRLAAPLSEPTRSVPNRYLTAPLTAP
jgi:hypothetical protein